VRTSCISHKLMAATPFHQTDASTTIGAAIYLMLLETQAIARLWPFSWCLAWAFGFRSKPQTTPIGRASMLAA
jgi:hypothetical protein